ncbi:MAG: hypothetical protein VW274_05375, partial [Thalassolituus sp.]
LADVNTYVTYYQQDAERIAEMTELDLSIVQPVLTSDQIRSLQSRGKAVVYLSIGEIGLSNTYWYNGEQVLGQVIYDDHNDWFLDQNHNFDTNFADTRIEGWQDFIVEQAGILLDQGYDGLFLDTVDTVDVYPATKPGMIELINLLRTTYPDSALVQNRGINIIPDTGNDVDALMFEVFNTYYNYDDADYTATNTETPGYSDLVDKALNYRLNGGVVLSQDFALPQPQYEDLICYARDRALQHLFVPSYADKFFQDGLFSYPDPCPWPEESGFILALNAPVINLSKGRIQFFDINTTSYLGHDAPVSLSTQESIPQVSSFLGSDTVSPGQSTTLEFHTGTSQAPGEFEYTITATSEASTGETLTQTLTPTVFVHSETIWVTNAGLSNIVAYDEPDTLSNTTIIPARKSGTAIAQPYSVAVAQLGHTWIVENVGSPDATQPAGRILRYAPFDLSEPEATFDTGFNYPLGIAIDSNNTVWIANSGIDWSGTPRGSAPNIVSLPHNAESGAEPTTAFTVDTAYGYPKNLATDGTDNLWITTTYGLVLGYLSPGALSGTPTPNVIISLTGGDADFLDTTNNLTFDTSGNLWVSGTYNSGSQSRIIKITANAWTANGVTTALNNADVPVVLTNG